MSTYLKKAEREEYLRQIAECESKKVLSMQDTRNYHYAKFFVGIDYLSRIRRNLDHIKNILYYDSVAEMRGIEKDFPKNIKYIDEANLISLKEYIRETEKALVYMSETIDNELGERNPPKVKKFSDHKGFE